MIARNKKAPATDDKAERCFRCDRFLGHWLEEKKMETEMGPICYRCFNEVQAMEREAEV